MHTHAGKTKENKSQSGANGVTQKKSPNEYTSQFVDNRPEYVGQIKLQEMANNRTHIKQAIQFKYKENTTRLHGDQKSVIGHRANILKDEERSHDDPKKPVQLQTSAIAHEAKSHLDPGQEEHLLHNQVRVIQQKQSRMPPTSQLQGQAIEVEAYKMADIIKQHTFSNNFESLNKVSLNQTSSPIQGRWTYNRDLAELKGEVIYYDTETNALYDPEIRELKIIGDKTGKTLSETQHEGLMKVINKDIEQEDYEQLLRLGFSEQDIAELDELEEPSEIDLRKVKGPRKVDIIRELNSYTAPDLTSLFILGQQIDTSRLDSASGEKTAFEVADDEDKAIIIKRHTMPSSISLSEEVETLNILKTEYKLPVCQVHTLGVINIEDTYYPTLVMKRYEGSSKMIGHNKSSRYVQSETAPEVVSMLDAETALKSLKYIASVLEGRNIAIPDLQFLVDDESNFLINDPNGFVTSRQRKTFNKVFAQNMELLGGLISTIKTYAKKTSSSEIEIIESKEIENDVDIQYWESEVERAEKANSSKLTRSILKRILKEDQTFEIQALVKRLRNLK